MSVGQHFVFSVVPRLPRLPTVAAVRFRFSLSDASVARIHYVQGDRGTVQNPSVAFIWIVPLPHRFGLGRQEPGRKGLNHKINPFAAYPPKFETHTRLLIYMMEIYWHSRLVKNSQIKVNESLLHSPMVTLNVLVFHLPDPLPCYSSI